MMSYNDCVGRSLAFSFWCEEGAAPALISVTSLSKSSLMPGSSFRKRTRQSSPKLLRFDIFRDGTFHPTAGLLIHPSTAHPPNFASAILSRSRFSSRSPPSLSSPPLLPSTERFQEEKGHAEKWSESGDANDIGEAAMGVLPVGGLSRRLVIFGVSSGARKGFDTMSSCGSELALLKLCANPFSPCFNAATQKAKQGLVLTIPEALASPICSGLTYAVTAIMGRRAMITP